MKYRAIKSKPGSAILIALFIMATVGAVSFTSAKIFVSELRATSNIASSYSAYYNAEGALENGLLEFRKDRNVQSCAAVICQDDSQTTDLAAPKNGGAMSQRIYYFNSSMNNLANLSKDEVIEVKISKPTGGTTSATLNWNWVGSYDYLDKTLFVKVFDGYDTLISSSSLLAPAVSATIPLSSDITSVRLKPLGDDIQWKVTPGDNNLVDPGETVIDAIGQSQDTNLGRVKRQLRAVINKSTGGLDSIFDYTLLTKQDI